VIVTSPHVQVLAYHTHHDNKGVYPFDKDFLQNEKNVMAMAHGKIFA